MRDTEWKKFALGYSPHNTGLVSMQITPQVYDKRAVAFYILARFAEYRYEERMHSSGILHYSTSRF